MAKKIPITRISKFFGSEDFSLEQDIGMEWLHGDMHFTMVLFRVDKKYFLQYLNHGSFYKVM